MKLNEGNINREYCVLDLSVEEEGMREFLFSLGCYPGENITIISHMASNYIVNIKDARYSLDENLASAINVREMDSENFSAYA